MTERESKEIAKVLLHLSDARLRAQRAADELARDGAAEHIVAALRASEASLADLHRQLSQGTYYAVQDDSLRLVV